MSGRDLLEWENDFLEAFQSIDNAKLQNSGSLLSIIPSHEKWDDFLRTVKAEWQIWQSNLKKYPACLVVLYGGLAFYEYKENTLWPQFAKAVGIKSLTCAQQNKINVLDFLRLNLI